MPAVTLTNLLTDPSFENNGWTAATNCTLSYVTSPVKYGSRALKVQSTAGTATECYFVQNASVYQTSGHIYYVRCEMYQESYVSSGMQAYWPQAEPSMGTASFNSSNVGTWTIMSFRLVRSTWGTGNQQFRFDVEGIRSPNNVYLDGAMVIDLTACFGSGNEPTKEWCDANIKYFEGTKKLSSINMRAKIDDSIKEISNGYVKINGVWKPISMALAKKDVWGDSSAS